VLCTGGDGGGKSHQRGNSSALRGGSGGGGTNVWRNTSPHNVYELSHLLAQHTFTVIENEKGAAEEGAGEERGSDPPAPRPLTARVRDWGIDPKKNARASCGYVGLSNPGCVCYINAVNQQLYMCPGFRYGILGVESPPSLKPVLEERERVDTTTTTTTTSSSEADCDGDDAVAPPPRAPTREELEKESLLWQLQRLMGGLELSAKQAVDPASGWLHAFKDEFGKAPTNPLVQQDANEYLLRLTDRLEAELKGTPQEQLLQELFRATFVTQMLPHDGSGRCRSKREKGYFVSVDVHKEGCGNLEAALQDYVKGEVLSFRFDDDDVHDSSQDASGDATAAAAPPPRVKAPMIDCTRRLCFASDALPPTLIIHLKRFYLDYNTFETKKYNNRFEFGRTLNVFPYTVEGIQWLESSGGDDDDADADANGHSCSRRRRPSLSEELKTLQSACEYELQGVVVHTGTMRYGHYYSFIHERGAPPDERWFKFNDTCVSEFNANDLNRQCFGGRERKHVWATAYGTFTRRNIAMKITTLKTTRICSFSSGARRRRPLQLGLVRRVVVV
jgi:ubiquitin carboxyl-terminal hydrolase 9/24